MTSIGFIGLGIMGAPMTGHLLAAGHKVVTCVNKNPVPTSLAAQGVVDLGSPRAVAEKSDVVIMILPDTPVVEEVLFGAEGLAKGLSRGKLVIDMSSIAPMATKDFAARIDALGCAYLDAPVSGGEVGAKEASLTIMVGGSETAFARAKPIFERMGKTVTLVGGNGHGQIAKVANQIIVALTIEAVGEALLFASKAGADPARVRQALMGGFAGSRILEVHGERMIKRSFTPGARIDLHRKDLGLALQGARALGLSLPNTATAQELFNVCAAHGLSNIDHSGLVRALEIMANHEIGSPAKK